MDENDFGSANSSRGFVTTVFSAVTTGAAKVESGDKTSTELPASEQAAFVEGATAFPASSLRIN
jgi:hypothetical protein